MKVAIFYESKSGQTKAIADRIESALRAAGHDVGLKRCSAATAGEVAAADAILVGAPVRIGKHHGAAIRFVKANLETLKTKPSGFFSVSLTARMKKPQDAAEMKKILETFAKGTGWEPDHLAFFAGALMFTRYWFLVRWLMKSIAKSEGSETDTSKDYVYTDWDSVDKFAAGFAQLLTGPAGGSTSDATR